MIKEQNMDDFFNKIEEDFEEMDKLSAKFQAMVDHHLIPKTYNVKQVSKERTNDTKPTNISLVGQVAMLTKKQTNRTYFSEIPIGTKFIIVEQYFDNPFFDFVGYFLNYPPQIVLKEQYHYTGFIEKDSWVLIGSINEIVTDLRSGF